MKTKHQNIQNDFKALRTPDIDLFASRISHQLRMYISWKPYPFSRGVDGCFPIIMEKPETLCISPILSSKESSKKSPNRHDHNTSSNPGLSKLSLRKPILIPRTDEPRDSRANYCDKQNTAISTLSSFREKFSAEGLTAQTISLLLDAKERQNQSL